MLNRITLIIFLSFIIIGCENKCIPNKTITKLRLTNKAQHFYGGLDSLSVIKTDQIQFISSELSKLGQNLKGSNLVKSNYGYVTVYFTNSECNDEEYFDLIFTENNGKIIRYGTGNYGTEKYYKNDKLAHYIQQILKLRQLNTE